MNVDDLAQKHDQLLKELRLACNKRDIAKAEAKRNTYRLTIAKKEIQNSRDNFGQTPIGAGMSSQATGAINATKDEIRSTLISTGVVPAVAAISSTSQVYGQF